MVRAEGILLLVRMCSLLFTRFAERGFKIARAEAVGNAVISCRPEASAHEFAIVPKWNPDNLAFFAIGWLVGSTAIEAIVFAVCDYLKEIHRNEKQCASQASFGALLDSALTRAIRIVVLDGLGKRATRTTVSNHVLASTISWAIYGATREWFYTTKRQRNDGIVSFVATVVVPILEAGVDRGAFSQLGTSKGEKTESRNRHRQEKIEATNLRTEKLWPSRLRALRAR